jgi:D-3-phosphoglycerate dehydrogenase / 2-oxoglutarate reductase
VARGGVRPIVAVVGARFGDVEVERAVLRGTADLVEGPGGTSEEFVATAGGAAGVLLGTAARCTAEVMARLEACRAIVRYGIGVDNVDLAAAGQRGIAVANVPDYCVEEVADHTLALMLACTRKLLPSREAVRAGRWRLADVRPMRASRDLTLGLVGFGKIARAVARRARACGFRLVAADPFVPAEAMRRFGASKVELLSLLAEADVISLHVPLTEGTRRLIGAEQLAAMKPTAVLVNTARGGLVDDAALAAALAAGRIAGAALDVLDREPPPADHPLLGTEGVLVTPHTAWYSERAERELRRRAAQEMRRVLRGRPPRNPVPPPSDRHTT